MQPSTIRQELFSLIPKQFNLEQTLAQSRDKMVKGSLFQWYTACREGHCKCTQGEKHGPFLYAAVKLKGKTIQRYVGKKQDEGLVKRLESYRGFRKKRLELNLLNRKIAGLWGRLEDSLLEGTLR